MRGKTVLAVFLVFSLIRASVGLVSASTPEVEATNDILGGEVQASDLALQILWNEDAEPLAGVAGWQPVSFRMVESDDDVYAFIELRNVSGAFTHAPELLVELYQGDFSFGAFSFNPEVPWVEDGESGFYQSLSFYDSSLGVADWDGIALGLAPKMYDPYDGLTSAGLAIDGRRLINESPNDIPPVYTGTFVRDSAGVYTGSCMGPTTGARTPAGGSVRLSAKADSDYTPMCGFSMVGIEGSEELGIGGPYVTEYYITGFDIYS